MGPYSPRDGRLSRTWDMGWGGGLLRGKSIPELSPMARRCARRMPQKETGEAPRVATVGIALGGRGLSEATQNKETTRCSSAPSLTTHQAWEKMPCPAEVDLSILRAGFRRPGLLGWGLEMGRISIDRIQGGAPKFSVIIRLCDSLASLPTHQGPGGREKKNGKGDCWRDRSRHSRQCIDWGCTARQSRLGYIHRGDPR